MHNFAFVTLMYNIGDYIGKMYSYLLTIDYGLGFAMYGLFRGAFFVIFYGLAVMYPNNVFWGCSPLAVVLHLLLGLTNGHFTTMNFRANAMSLQGKEIGVGAGIIV